MLCIRSLDHYLVQWSKQGYSNPAGLEPLGWSPALLTSPSHFAQNELWEVHEQPQSLYKGKGAFIEA